MRRWRVSITSSIMVSLSAVRSSTHNFTSSVAACDHHVGRHTHRRHTVEASRKHECNTRYRERRYERKNHGALQAYLGSVLSWEWVHHLV